MTTPDDPSRMPAAPLNAVMIGETSRLAHQIADGAVVQTLRQLSVATQLDGSAHTWYDTRPMLSLQERSAESVDKCRAALAYGDYRRLFVRHPEQSHMVRLVSPQ